MRREIYKTAALALSAVMLTGCGGKGEIQSQMQGSEKETATGTIPATQASISRDELYEILKNKTIGSRNYTYYVEYDVANDASTNAVGSSKSIGNAKSESADHSETNNQTEGVDEGDIIKTDGKYIYYVNSADDTVLISEVNDGQAHFISKIKAESDDTHIRSISEINIYGDKLIIIMNQSEDDYRIYEDVYKYDCCGTRESNTVCEIYDLSDRNNPKKLEEHIQDGYFNTSRVNGDVLYLVSSSYKNLRDEDRFLPTVDGQEVAPDKVAIPGTISSFDVTYTVISSIDLEDSFAVKDTVSVCGDSPQIYMSSDSMYVANSYYDYKVLADNPDTIKKYITEHYEKNYKNDKDTDLEWEWYEKYVIPKIKDNEKEKLEGYEADAFDSEFPEYKGRSRYKIRNSKVVDISLNTRISKFDISGGKLSLTGQGETEGTVENNLCMDEKDGYLRMFTGEWGNTELADYTVYYVEDKEICKGYEYGEYLEGKEESNRVSVFDNNMNRVATIDNIAEKESIYAARFIGNYGYVVTFEQTDPLFTVDFSDPKNPKIVGELVMPGYSENLFSYGEDMLFGIGELDWDTKLEMYNIKGNQATILATKVLKNGYTDAMYDYKDVMVEYEKNIIGFGMYDWGDTDCDSDYMYKLYRYTGSSFEEIASIQLEASADQCYDGMARAVYIGDYIYICYGNNIYWLNYKNDGSAVNTISCE